MKRDQGLRFMLQKQVVLCLIAIFIIGIGYIRVKPVAAEVATSTIEYVSGSCASSIARSENLSVTITNKATGDYMGNPQIFAEIVWKGETVVRVTKDPEIPVYNWSKDKEYTDTIILPAIPFNAVDASYEVRTGFVDTAYKDGSDNKLVGNVVIGSPIATVTQKCRNIYSLTIPSGIVRGTQFSGLAYIQLSQAIDYDTTAYLQFWKNGILWDVLEIPGTIKTSEWEAGSEQTVNFNVTLADDGLPNDTYDIKFGLHKININQPSGVTVNLSGETRYKKLYKPISYGNFIDKRAGQTHFWYVNQNNAMTWDGEPYIPMGGMVTSSMLVNYDSNNTEKNQTNWNKDSSCLTTLKNNGVKDIYLNAVTDGMKMPAWSWQFIIDRFESDGFQYGIQLNAKTDASVKTPVYIIHENETSGGTYKLTNVTTSGMKTLTTNGIGDIMSVQSCLFSVIDDSTGELVQSGTGTMSLSQNNFIFNADINLPNSNSHTVYFVPRVTISGWRLPNFWDGLDALTEKLQDFTSKLELGPNFRFWLDPVTNESGIYNNVESCLVDSDIYRTRYINWLVNKYGTISNLNDNWNITPTLSSFEEAVKLIPLAAGPSGASWENKIYLVEPITNTTYTSDTKTSVYWDDHLAFFLQDCGECNNAVADALSLNADTPVVLKHCGVTSDFYVNRAQTGGFDGIGGEIYAYQDDVIKGKLGLGYADAESSLKTMWHIATETSDRENFTAKQNSGIHGYGSQALMNSNFNALLEGGAKGIFDFLLTCPHDPFIESWYAYTSNVSQFDWLTNYRNAKLTAQGKENIMSSTISPYYIYPSSYSYWYYPNLRTALLPGGDYVSICRVAKDSSGHTYFSTNNANIRTNVLVTSLNNATATSAYGSALNNKNLKNGSNVTVFCGLRGNLGALPEIDAYYTSVTISVNGATCQVLNPTDTSTVLYSTNGAVWGLRDGNLIIISNSKWLSNIGTESNAVNFLGNIDLTPRGENSIRATWDFMYDREGFTAKNIKNFDWQEGGYIVGTNAGNDPYIISELYLGTDININKTIKLKLKNTSTSTSGKIYFTTDSSPSFNEANSIAFTIKANDSDYTEYTINMTDVSGWTGTLRQLRIDPNDAPSGSFGIDYIKILNDNTQSPGMAKNWEFNEDTEGFTSKNIQEFGWQTGGYVGGINASSDPYMVSADKISTNINVNKTIRIRLKNDTLSTTGKIYFTTTSDTAWSESKAMSFLITANSDFIEYTIDMSGTLGWTGTLKQLRIDPNTAPSGSFSIDYIRISSE